MDFVYYGRFITIPIILSAFTCINAAVRDVAIEGQQGDKFEYIVLNNRVALLLDGFDDQLI